MKKNFLITTGGSGGHVIPACILYEHLMEDYNVIISTDKRGLKYFDKDLSQLEIINTPKLNNIFFLPFNIFFIFFLFIKSIILLNRYKIDKIFSTGGYMSLPIILAAKFLRKDIYLIEPNQVLGRANKFFLKSCKKIFCYSDKVRNFPKNQKKKIIKIFPLVKKYIYELQSSSNNNDKIKLLVVGGSQGAKIFDNDLKNAIVNISKHIPLKIIHQTSKKNIPLLSDFYLKNDIENEIFNFEKNIAVMINQTDICITRAGASTLAELSFLNIPFRAVPLPTSKDNHQFENANFYRNNDCCWIIEENLFEQTIEKTLKHILEKKIDYLNKKRNLKKLNYQNTWINVNQKILENINEN